MIEFKDRLRDLIKNSGKTQKSVSEEIKEKFQIDLSAQTLSYYVNGREPNYETLRAISRYFGVSSDYLLGLSDVQNTDPDIKAISEKTGLSEKSLNIFIEHHTPPFVKEGRNLTEWKDHFMKMTNILIESEWLESVLFRLDFYFYNLITVYELEKYFINKEDSDKKHKILNALKENPATNIDDFFISIGDYMTPLKNAIATGFKRVSSPIMDLTVDKEYLSYKLCKDMESDVNNLLSKNYEQIKPLCHSHDSELTKFEETISEFLAGLEDDVI